MKKTNGRNQTDVSKELVRITIAAGNSISVAPFSAVQQDFQLFRRCQGRTGDSR